MFPPLPVSDVSSLTQETSWVRMVRVRLTQADKGAEVREEGPALISLSGLHSLAEGAAE